MRKEIKVLIVFAVTISGATLISGCMENNNQGSPGGKIGVYPGSEQYAFPTTYSSIMGIPSNGVIIKSYKVSGANIEDILNWYENKMNSSGWEFQERYPVTTISAASGSVSFGGVLFKKEDVGEGIWAWRISSQGGETFYVIATGSWSKFSGGGEVDQLPGSDQAQGEEPVQRYSGSVMTNYEKDISNPTIEKIYIDYGTNDEAITVANWYKQYLQNNGWMLEQETSDDTGYSLDFSKGAEYMEISIFKPSETTAYTEIDLYYTKTKLPDADQISGYEPVSRYPDSVMLQYTNSSYMGVILLTIKYGTAAGIDEVMSWYQSNMPTEGWSYVSAQTTENGKEITFSKTQGSTTKMIDIMITNKTAYTSIEINYTSYSS